MDELSVGVLCLAGYVFAASGAVKLRSRRAYSSFRDGLRETGLVPERRLPYITAVLCSAEAAIAAGLLTTAVLTAVAASGAALLAESVLTAASCLTGVLTVGVAVVIRRGTRARCACFGAASSRPIGRAHLVRNLSLLAVVCVGLATVPLTQPRPVMVGTLLAAAVSGVAALLFIRWDDLADLLAPIPRPATGSQVIRLPRRDSE
jgi:Methylamine utilisation protein MauE